MGVGWLGARVPLGRSCWVDGVVGVVGWVTMRFVVMWSRQGFGLSLEGRARCNWSELGGFLNPEVFGRANHAIRWLRIEQYCLWRRRK